MEKNMYAMAKHSFALLLLALMPIIAMAQGMVTIDCGKDGVGGGKTWSKYKAHDYTQSAVSLRFTKHIQRNDHSQIQKNSTLTITVSAGQIKTVDIYYNESATKTANNMYTAASFGGQGTYDAENAIWTANEGENVTTLVLKNTEGPTYIDALVINQRTYQLTIGEHGYATCALPFAYVIPDNSIVGSPALAVNDGGVVAFDWRYDVDKIVPANMPLVLKGTPGITYTLGETTEASDVPTPATNLLVGNATDAPQTLAEASTKYYGLGKGTDGNYGFYKTTALGADITLPANRCALALPATSEAPNFLSFGGVVTAIATATAPSAQPTTVYNLQGQSVGTTSTWQHLPKGIYIIAGKKVAK
ncbi:MAG: hypothetical protein Q4A44_05885 [Bacteroidales bacterium]|nr:hypothetical protein [Bacteroidales bacterium]